MLESILFALNLSINAVDESKVIAAREQEINRCLLAKECVAEWDRSSEVWLIKRVNKESLNEKEEKVL